MSTRTRVRAKELLGRPDKRVCGQQGNEGRGCQVQMDVERQIMGCKGQAEELWEERLRREKGRRCPGRRGTKWFAGGGPPAPLQRLFECWACWELHDRRRGGWAVCGPKPAVQGGQRVCREAPGVDGHGRTPAARWAGWACASVQLGCYFWLAGAPAAEGLSPVFERAGSCFARWTVVAATCHDMRRVKPSAQDQCGRP